MSLIIYCKALAFFRGNAAVELEDVRQILPFVFHSRLFADEHAPFFDLPENACYRSDKIGWLRRLFDLACADFNRLGLDRDDEVREISAEFDLGLDGITAGETKKRIERIERLLMQFASGKKLYGHIFDDVLKLKYLHQRYTNYLSWLESQ